MKRIPGPLVLVLAVLCCSAVLGQTPGTQIPRPGTTQGAQAPGMPSRDNRGPQSGTARIRGRVVAAQTGLPLRRARVMISSTQTPFFRSATTDSEGRFEFIEVPAGRFSLSANKPGYVMLQYGQRRPFEAGRPVTISDGEQVERIDFALTSGSVIVVRVTDDFGEPLAGAQIQVQRFLYGPDGQRRLTGVPSGVAGAPFMSVTDDRGELRAFGLTPGEYVVSASVRSIGIPGSAGNEDRDGFAPTFYPGTVSPAEAQAISIGAGEERSIQFAMTGARLSRISGTVFNSEGRPAVGAQLLIMTRQGNGGSVTGRGATITGRVVFEGSSPRENPSGPLRVFANPSDPANRMFSFGGGDPLSNGVLDSNGNFQLSASGGPVFFTVATPPAWVVKSVTLDGTDVTDEPFDLAGKQSVSGLIIRLTDKLTQVSGRVTDGRGQVLHDYTVIIQPAEATEPIVASRLTRIARPDTSGRFETRGLRPGRYMATAIQTLEQGRQFAPEY